MKALGAGAVELRAWQAAAQTQFFDLRQRTWLTTATPGAGKTTYALSTARRLFEEGIARRLYIVVPTDHLRAQWIEAAARFGFDLRPVANETKLQPEADGAVVTYAQVALKPAVHEARCRSRQTVAVLDEVHHAGDSKSWGTAATDAFNSAAVRFLLTGTPFRSDDAQIAHVRYEDSGDGERRSVADFTYGYRQALTDGVVRPVVFATYGGDATWQTSMGEVRAARLGDAKMTRADEDAAWRAVLDPDGEWIPHVLAAAWGRINDLRTGSIPDGKVLIPASSQELARAYADVWRQITGNEAVLVLSDDDESSQKIREFRDDPDQVCCVCVRMVTEGVDIPAAAVLVWATTASTPMFFAQMVGRVIRARNRQERATVFLPAVGKLIGLAYAMEVERDHVIGRRQTDSDSDSDEVAVVDLPASEDEEALENEGKGGWRPLHSSAAFRDVIGSGTEELFGLPGLLSADQEKALLRARDAENAAKAREVAKARARQDAAAHAERLHLLRTGQAQHQPHREPTTRIENAADEVADLRRKIAAQVHGYAATKNLTMPQAWAELYRRCPGPKNPEASLELLRRRWGAVRRM